MAETQIKARMSFGNGANQVIQTLIKTTAELKGLKRATDTFNQNSDKGYKRAGQGAIQLNKKLKSLGISATNYNKLVDKNSSALYVLEKRMNNTGRASDGLSSKFKKGFSQESLQGFSKKLFNIKTLIGGIAISLGLMAGVKFIGNAVNEFASFQKSMNEVFTLVPELSAQGQQAMLKDTREFAKKFGVEHEGVAKASYQAISAGVSQKDIFPFLEIANKAAVGGVATLEESVGTLTTVMNNYKESGITAGQASDMLFTIVKKGVTSFPELATSIGDILPSANSAGVMFNEVSGAMATLTATMGKGSTPKAVTSLRSMIDELNNSSTVTFKTFQRISGKTFKEFMQSGGSLADVLKMMKDEAGRTNVQVADLFQSVEAKKAVNVLSDNTESFTNNLNEMNNAIGATDGAFNQMDKGLEPVMRKLKVRFDDFRIGLGERLAPAIEKAGNKLIDMLENEKTQQGIEKLVNGIGTFADNLPAIIDNLPLIAVGIGTITTAMIALNVATYANPIGALIAGIVFLIGVTVVAVMNLVKNWDLAVSKFRNGIDSIKGVFKEAELMVKSFGLFVLETIQTIVSFIPGIGNALSNSMNGAIDGIRSNISFLKSDINGLKSGIKGREEVAKYKMSGVSKTTSSTIGYAQRGAGIKNNWTGNNFFEGGLTWLAEKGRELLQLPDNNLIKVEKPQVMDLPRGTKIFNNHETEKILKDKIGQYKEKLQNSKIGKKISGFLSGDNTTNNNNSTNNNRTVNNNPNLVINLNPTLNFSGSGENKEELKGFGNEMLQQLRKMIEEILNDREKDQLHMLGGFD